MSGQEPPRCPKCGYTKADAMMHGDHHLCSGTIPGTKVSARIRSIAAVKACRGIPTEALEADVVKRMRDKLSELAADLESELDARYPKEIREYPSEERRYQRDMSIVNEARAILKELDAQKIDETLGEK